MATSTLNSSSLKYKTVNFNSKPKSIYFSGYASVYVVMYGFTTSLS